MAGMPSIQVDLAREVLLGSRRVPLTPAERAGVFRVGSCCEIRAVSFGERSRIVQAAHESGSAESQLRESLYALAIRGEGGAEALPVALALAGGAEEAPGFATVAAEALRLNGWDWETLSQQPAIEVDRMLSGMFCSPPADQGWKRIVFAPPKQEDMEKLSVEMTQRLLLRGLQECQVPSLHQEEAVRQGYAPVQASTLRAEPAATIPSPEVDRQEAMAATAVSKRPVLRFAFDPKTSPVTGPPIEAIEPQGMRRFVRGRFGAGDAPRSEIETAAPAPEAIRARWSLSPGGPATTASSPRESSETARDATSPSVLTAAAQTAPGHATTFHVAGTPAWPTTIAHGQGATYPANSSWAAYPQSDPPQPFRQTKWPRHSADTSTEHMTEAAEGVDWLTEIARALADECDLRGLDT